MVKSADNSWKASQESDNNFSVSTTNLSDTLLVSHVGQEIFVKALEDSAGGVFVIEYCHFNQFYSQDNAVDMQKCAACPSETPFSYGG